jgi:hypothetical protein
VISLPFFPFPWSLASLNYLCSSSNRPVFSMYSTVFFIIWLCLPVVWVDSLRTLSTTISAGKDLVIIHVDYKNALLQSRSDFDIPDSVHRIRASISYKKTLCGALSTFSGTWMCNYDASFSVFKVVVVRGLLRYNS